MTIWIEIVKERHDLRKDGRQDWAYGKSLWSPTRVPSLIYIWVVWEKNFV